MAFNVLWKTLLFGPMTSAICFGISLGIIDLFTVSKVDLHHGAEEFIGALAIMAMFSYVFVFVSPFGGVPGIIPLFIYASTFSILINPAKHLALKYSVKRYVTVLFITLLSLIIGIITYGLFFYLNSTHSNHVGHLLFSIVIPTSVFFGLIFGVSYARKNS